MITHIKHVHEQKTWCDLELTNDFAFTIEQACVNGLHATSKLACEECTQALIKTLQQGAILNEIE